MRVERYRGRKAALPTLHGKAEAIAPPLAAELGLSVATLNLDTDAFGTFAGEIPRTGTPLEAARRKAAAALDRGRGALVIASEGSIGPDPRFPLATVDAELIIFIDSDLGLEVVETHWSLDTKSVRETVGPGQDLARLIARAGLPEHGVIVRAAGGQGTVVAKGIRDEVALSTAVIEAAALSDAGQAIVESDLRAHMSPTRMRAIADCAWKLARRLATACPACDCPGWGQIEPVWGLPCSACGTQIPHLASADRLGCVRCPEVVQTPRAQAAGDPKWCPYCNP